MLIDVATGRVCCRHCAQDRKVVKKVVEVWPEYIRSYLESSGTGRALCPQHLPNCPVIKGSGTLSITSPPDGQKYVSGGASSDGSDNGSILFQSAGGERWLCWFIDGEFFRKAAPDERIFWTPSDGSHQIRCIDATGRSATSNIRIK
jgi:penicillin-binding protein 1C